MENLDNFINNEGGFRNTRSVSDPYHYDNLWPLVAPVLDDALIQLSRADLDAILLRYVEKMSYGEMAIALGISPTAVHKGLICALVHLRHNLDSAGIALTVAMLDFFLAEKMVESTPKAIADHILTAVVSV